MTAGSADRRDTGSLREQARTCIVTRQEQSPTDMIRFVLGPDGVATPDLKRKLPGRGVWVSGSAAIVAQAIKRKAFERGFKTKASAPEDLVAIIDRLLTRDCLQSLSLANKAGLVTTGFAKVESMIGGGAVALLLHATDGGADGKRKLGQAVRRRFGGDLAGSGKENAPQEIETFDSAQLDLALGRTNVIHAAIRPAAASAALLAQCRRLEKYRGVVDDDKAAHSPAGTSGKTRPEACAGD